MEDNKNLNENEVLENEENLSADSLNEELEQIAQTFREELAKAQSEQEQNDSMEAEAGDFDETESEEQPIPEEDLCACCGERVRDKEYGEDYEYCEECREAMRHNPISFSSLLIAVLVGVMAVLSVTTFLGDADGYYHTYKAKTYKEDKMLDSAIAEYDNAIAYFEGRNIIAKNLYLESADIIFKTMPQGTASMNDISDRISTALKGFSYKLPMYKKSVALRNENLALYGTMESFYSIMSKTEYADYSANNTQMYASIMAEIEALIGTELSVASIDGKSTETVIVNEGMVRFCQYMFAYASERFDETDKYLEKVYELEPEYVWLYAYELGIIHIKNGEFEKAQDIAKTILDNNTEEADGYCIYSTVARMSGDTEKAVQWAEKGCEYCPTDSEMLRTKAMAHVVAGDMETAKTIIDEAMTYNEYGLLYYTSIVIENELGNTEKVNEMIATIEGYGLKLSDKMYNYLDGKITAKQVFTEGTGDVE